MAGRTGVGLEALAVVSDVKASGAGMEADCMADWNLEQCRLPRP